MGLYCFEDTKIEVLEDDRGDCFIKDKLNDTYYFKERYNFFEVNSIPKGKVIGWNVKDSIVAMLIILSIVDVIIIINNRNIIFEKQQTLSFVDIVHIYCFTMLNVFFHECAHMCMMLFYNRKVGKPKFKLYYKLFPCIVVDTSDSYMLPRYRRAFVYYAGIMVNLFVCGLIIVFASQYAYLLVTLTWVIIFNIFPFGCIKSDGYRIVLDCIFNVKGIKNQKSVVSRAFEFIFWIMTFFLTCKSWIAIIN